MCKPLLTELFLPTNPADVVVSENVELDFSDVFGPVPVQTSAQLSCSDLGNSVVDTSEVSEIIYEDSVVIYNRSHSLVGPSSCVSESLKLSKLTLHETQDSEELLDCVEGDTIKEFEESSIDEVVSNDELLENVNGCSRKVLSVGIEDFEVLKVVGQGAFGRVYQVRKKHTSEIYAMKVMRKDKIMENNHAKYMKAERDILTKIDHPFIVQLKYSFQVIFTIILKCSKLFLLCIRIITMKNSIVDCSLNSQFLPFLFFSNFRRLIELFLDM